MTQIINYSEFNTLSQCERKWVYAYVLNQLEEGSKRGLHLGTLLHKGHENWMLRRGATLPKVWTDDISSGGKPGDTQEFTLADFDPELVLRAEWLLARWASFYGSEPPSHWNVMSTESWLTRDMPWGTLVGRTDGAIEIDGQIWLNEVKSYGSKGRMNCIQVDPQLGTYSLLFEAEYGVKPFGIIYDGIYTYQWKRTKPTQAALKELHPIILGEPKGTYADRIRAIQAEHPGDDREPAESFDRRFIDLSDDHLTVAQSYLAAAVRRRTALVQSGDVVQPLTRVLDEALPNVGKDCDWCGFKDRCWSELGGVEPDEITLEDEPEEPV